MTTSNDTSSNKITKRDLKSVFFRSLTMEYSWNYERQQHMGYCFSMLPIIRRVYKNKDDQAAAAKRHMEFFNTTPYVSTLILGISAAMEEANANEEDFDESSINSVKAALMSPLAGIGDSLFWERCVSSPLAWVCRLLCRVTFSARFSSLSYSMFRII